MEFFFREPGLVEGIAYDPSNADQSDLLTPGYRSVGTTDLMVDCDPRTNRPYCFMSSNFERTYPLVIWSLKFQFADELFDIPQAHLRGVPLHVAFSWAYYHFILEDGKRLPVKMRKLAASAKRKLRDPSRDSGQALARTVLTYSVNSL